MKQIRRRLSYANVVSSLALFLVVAGGSAFAANQLAKNSVGAKQLKKGAVSTAKLKKNAVTAAKIKPGAVTGAKIDVKTLGTVPSATSASHAATATSAQSAGSATNALNAENFSKFFSSGLKKASHGQTVTLLTVGPFTITGKCVDDGGGYSEALIEMTTSQVGSSMYSYEDNYDEADWNPGTTVELNYDISDNDPYVNWDDQYPYYTGWWAASADGQYLLHGDAVNAVNVFGSQCAFWIEATNAA